MNNKKAKQLKKALAIKMYVGDDVSKQDVLDDRKSIYKNKEFKNIYRARKRNYIKGII